MQEIAPGAVGAEPLPIEGMAGPSFVGHLLLRVALQLGGSVGELALAAVGAGALLHEIATQGALGLGIESMVGAIVGVDFANFLPLEVVAALGGGLG